MFNFQNILKSRQLWFSSFDSMNDSEEGKFLKNYIHEVYFRDKFKTADNVPSLKKLEEYEKKLYSISFSTEADDSSQWDRYGDKGCGVCIVFSFKAFSQFFYNQFLQPTPNHRLLAKRIDSKNPAHSPNLQHAFLF